MKNIVGIRFFDQLRTYHFDAQNLKLSLQDIVIVSTAKGLQIGKVERLFVPYHEDGEYAPVIRLATEKDLRKREKLANQEKRALIECQEIVEEEGLPMKLVDARYAFDKNTLTFSFFAEKRVDFRNLLKILASTYKTRIELIQIGVRDKAREIGGIGMCGQELCCARFLNKLDNVSINMAKNQDLALNPNKINGVCGRLLCCLNYENENYTNCKKKMSPVGKEIKTDQGPGKIIKINCLKQTYDVQLKSGEIIEIKEQNGKNK